MYSPKKIVSLCVALLGLAAMTMLVTTGTLTASPHLNTVAAAPAPSIPVSVVNTPLPVSIATPVAVNSLPAITGNVSAALTNSSMTIANTSASPVLVQNVNDGRNISAYDLTLTNDTADYGPTTSICLNSSNCQISFDVPAGQRFVVEHVSAFAEGVGGQTYLVDFLGNVAEYLVLEKQGSIATLDLFTASQPMRAYIDSGSVPSPVVQVEANSGGNFFATCHHLRLPDSAPVEDTNHEKAEHCFRVNEKGLPFWEGLFVNMCLVF